MQYNKIYQQICDRAKNRKLEGYHERHHIIPVCFCKNPQCPGYHTRRKHTCGLDDVSNLVDLTAEEHYVAHQLLVKMYPGNRKLIFAARMMHVSKTDQFRNNKTYGWLKRKFAATYKDPDYVSPLKGKSPSHNFSEETRKKMSKSAKARCLRNNNITHPNFRSDWLGKKHNRRTKQKISAAMSVKCSCILCRFITNANNLTNHYKSMVCLNQCLRQVS